MKLIILTTLKAFNNDLSDIRNSMVQIAGRPLLQIQIELAERYGFREIILLIGSYADSIVQYFGDGSSIGVNITYLKVPPSFGTYGALTLTKKLLGEGEKFIFFNSNIVPDFDLSRFVAFELSHENSCGSLILRPSSNPLENDLVEIDRNSRIIDFYFHPHRDDMVYQNLINVGVFILSEKIIQDLDLYETHEITNAYFLRIVKDRYPLYGYTSPEYFEIIGESDKLDDISSEFIQGIPEKFNLASTRKAVFIDRDGVLNQNVDPPIPGKLDVFEGVAKALKTLNQSEYLSIIVTNQSAIAKGYITLSDLNLHHKILETAVGKENAFFDAIYYCPHYPYAGIEGEVKELKIECECRKPKPGMLIEAQMRFNIDLEKSWIIGDSDTDILAGKSAGCKTIQVGERKCPEADYWKKDFVQAVRFILEKN